MDFPNIINWRVFAKVDWNLKHQMHSCECYYTAFQWKLWIGLEFFDTWKWTKNRRALPLELEEDEVHYVENLNNFNAWLNWMHSSNIMVRHHIIFHIQYKTTNIKLALFSFSFLGVEVLRNFVWVKCDYFEALSHWNARAHFKLDTLEGLITPANTHIICQHLRL